MMTPVINMLISPQKADASWYESRGFHRFPPERVETKSQEVEDRYWVEARVALPTGVSFSISSHISVSQPSALTCLPKRTGTLWKNQEVRFKYICLQNKSRGARKHLDQEFILFFG